MKVVLTDGTTFTCGGYKALDSGGVVLTDDRKRKLVIGYVPEASLAYILPDDVEPGGNGKESEDSESEADDGELDHGDDRRTDDEGANVNSDQESDDEGEHENADDGSKYSLDDEDDAVVDEAAEAVSDDDDDAEHVVSVGVEPAAEGVTSVESGDVVGEHTHEDVVERVEHLESRVDGLDGRVDAMTEQLADIVVRETVPEEARSPEDVRNIRGIGEAYANRLRASGIDTIAALSEASDAEITAAVDVSERRASEWRRRAKTAVESNVTDGV